MEDRYKRWYEENKVRLQARRKARYASDPEVRRRAVEYAREYRRTHHLGARWQRMRVRKDTTERRIRPRFALVNGVRTACYSTRDAAERLGVTYTTFLGWERRGTVPPPTIRDDSGHRWYAKEYLATLQVIVNRARERKWSTEEFRAQAWKGVKGAGGGRNHGGVAASG